MLDGEAKVLIDMAHMYIRQGVNTKHLTNEEVKKMMKKIAVNAVCIGLYNFNRFIISNIGDGDFASIKLGWGSVINDFNRCMKIIDNEGENLKDILTPEEITEATNYTIFEQTGENED
jgi:hypothetical protein